MPPRIPPAAVLVDDANVYQPDIVALGRPPEDESSYVGTPLLVVEVLSPSTHSRDRHVKVARLLDLGVEEAWLVDPAGRTVERMTRVEVSRAGRGETLRSHVLPAFALTVDDLFSPPVT